MTKEELQERMGLEDGEAKDWNGLSYDDKAWVARVLKENGFQNAADVIYSLTSEYEQASFGRFWLAVDESDIDDMQSYFD